MNDYQKAKQKATGRGMPREKTFTEKVWDKTPAGCLIPLMGAIIIFIILGAAWLQWSTYNATAPGLGLPAMTYWSFLGLKFILGK
jgi:hypothetical protein